MAGLAPGRLASGRTQRPALILSVLGVPFIVGCVRPLVLELLRQETRAPASALAGLAPGRVASGRTQRPALILSVLGVPFIVDGIRPLGQEPLR